MVSFVLGLVKVGGSFREYGEKSVIGGWVVH